jgi:mannose-6-phosphate isomerase-like protein (cupin superfamily)
MKRPPVGSRSLVAVDERAPETSVRRVQERLAAANGGYEVVYTSPALEVGVYVLVAPEPDRQQPHEDDELYVVLEGRGTLEVEGKEIELEEGESAFVAARAEHRFTSYEQLSVLAIFARGSRSASAS